MIFETAPPVPSSSRQRIEAATHAGETACLEALIDDATFSGAARRRIRDTATGLVEGIRSSRRPAGGIDIFLQEYGLSTEEGVTLMCLAESLLRVPDDATADRLIRDKIGGVDWAQHLGGSGSLFVNASTWALMLTGRVVRLDQAASDEIEAFLLRMVRRSGEPVIREALRHAMRIIGRQFVMGRTIDEALTRAADDERNGYRHSYDMLGEGARTAADAETYFAAYAGAIGVIGGSASGTDLFQAPGISVKLSALHPRYEYAARDRVLRELPPRLAELCVAAKDAGIGLCVDAEEADRLELSLDIFELVAADRRLAAWDGLGLAVQAYQKRAHAVIDWLAELSVETHRRLMVRLVKGAYWDTEIKRAQQDGYSGYPVFTWKAATDVSYLACARKLLAAPARFFPQFASHNAHTVAAVAEMASAGQDFEYQRLHGMGEALYDQIVSPAGTACRVYAPVGGHESLLAYLVRRLLENGANTSFVSRIADDELPVAEVIADPAAKTKSRGLQPNPQLPLPADLYGPSRRNSAGDDLSNPARLRDLAAAIPDPADWAAGPIVSGELRAGAAVRPVANPANPHETVGHVHEVTDQDIEDALAAAAAAAPAWDRTPAGERAGILDRAAQLLEDHRAELFGLCILEAGKTLADAVAEVREAVDFCRYYAAQARQDFEDARQLTGPTGETNRLALHGRGVFVCISPWNFPLAIFTGQIAAALAAGNTVIAKPAEQTPLIAARAVELFYEAGLPAGALHLLPGEGPRIGGRLTSDPRISGIAFTGSFATAQQINRGLAARPGAIVPLIAETGGQNAMIVDSTALAEQVVDDVVQSAFQSAGQRCSALRCLFLQDDIADHVLDMLSGRAAELTVGDPRLLATDVGPVIDEDARARLAAHAERMAGDAECLFEANLPGDLADGIYFAPRIYLIDHINQLTEEVFGPVLHVVRYRADQLDQIIDDINATGYGLTMGIHSRVNDTIDYIVERLRTGNIYVNRNMIGAVVGVQPFGGEGLSGTGPKAGGPHYLHRFATERTLSVDTTAAGGNAALLSQDPRPPN